MSSFFTRPTSQSKRKRARPSGSAPRRKAARDESVSGSDVSADDASAAGHDEDAGTSDGHTDDEFEDEDPAAKRVRLAEQYLANTQQEVLAEGGFDAAEVDRENLQRRMGERLKEDTAEGRGKLYRWVADALDWGRARPKTQRIDGRSVVGCAIRPPYVYTVQRDTLCKWELPTGRPPMQDGKAVGRARSQPKRVAYTRGDPKRKRDTAYMHHVAPILCVAASADGQFVATGGADHRLIVWDAHTLAPLQVFRHHRDAVTGLGFRRGTNQLFSASKDRTVKIWSLDERAYIETLFGHQDEVVDVSALAREQCVTVGARDRTARLWKVVEESQLVFRGGGGGPGKRKGDDSGAGVVPLNAYHEGSIDRVACIDDDTFITGADNGSLSLWNIHKKKPVFTYPLAHGRDPPPPAAQLSAEADPHPEDLVREPQPRWITALRALPFSDTFVTGSWDGYVRAWRVTPDKRRLEPLGPIGPPEPRLSATLDEEPLVNGERAVERVAQEERGRVPGIINDLSIVDVGERGTDGVLIAAAIGKEHRLGRWQERKEAKVGLVLLEVPRRSLREPSAEAEAPANGVATHDDGEEDGFAGFD